MPCTLPNRVNDRPVATARALPAVIVLMHGVNDLGVSYPAQEQGLCQGLNERLSRKDMEPAGYRLPPKERNDKLLDDPDAVYFRRDEKGYSPVIPFYWGYRELRSKVQTNTPHGQYLDRYGNRMDKSGAQGGGHFANATSNLPDMWSGDSNPTAASSTWRAMRLIPCAPAPIAATWSSPPCASPPWCRPSATTTRTRR